MRRVLLALIVLCAGWAIFVAFTGGFEFRTGDIRIKSTEPDRPLYAAALLSAAYIYFFRQHARHHVEALTALLPLAGRVERIAAPLAMLAAAVTLILGITRGELVAAGADSWGYVSQADLWLTGDLVIDQSIAREVPWPEADWTFAPLGYRPAQRAGAIVPIYAPGLPVLMAAGKAILGACGPFVIVPILSGLTIWLTYVLGSQVWSPLAGGAAAALMATSPPFMFMVMNPMSDVPVTAFFLLGLVAALSSRRRYALWTGAAVSVAIFIRPNLVPLGGVFLVFVVLRARPNPGDSAWRSRARAFLEFGIGGAPPIIAIAILNAILYGAPWNASYGSISEFYAWRHWSRNLTDYSRWLWEKETPFIALAALPLLLWRSLDSSCRAAIGLLVAFSCGIWLSYLFYNPFGVWWYLRFLLPAFPPMLVMAVVGLALLLRRVAAEKARPAFALLVLVPVLTVRVAHIRGTEALSLWQQGIPYVSAAAYVERELPANAVIITIQHSGSIRYYANRLTLRWDYLAPEWWPRALNVLADRGFRPYLLVTSYEEEEFRRRFGMSSADDAPGTIVAALQTPERLRIYDPLRLTPRSPRTIAPIVACPCGCIGRLRQPGTSP